MLVELDQLHPHHMLGSKVTWVMTASCCYTILGNVFLLRLERRGGQQICLSFAVFLITQPFLNINRHAIHRINAEYHSYLLVSMILYN